MKCERCEKKMKDSTENILLKKHATLLCEECWEDWEKIYKKERKRLKVGWLEENEIEKLWEQFIKGDKK